MTENPELGGNQGSDPGQSPGSGMGGPAVETKPLGAGSMLVKIFTEPSAVYKSIKVKNSWALPIIIFLLVTLTVGIVTFPYQLNLQKQAIAQNEKMSQEQRDLAMQQMDAAEGNIIFAVIGAVVQSIGAVIFLFIAVGLYMLMGSVILGGSAAFGQVFSLTCWSTLPLVVGSIVKFPLILSKESIDVRTSLALLMPDAKMTDPMVGILNGLTDVFTIWTMIITIIGISIVYNFSKGRAAAVVLVPTAVLTAIGVGLASAFGG